MRTLLALIICLLAASSVHAADPQYDLLIRHGKIIDGTGNPWFIGDVAIKGDKIVAIGRAIDGTARREIDAKGLVVAPGFIDMHSHSDYLVLEDGHAQSKIRQGVTTDVLGEGQSVGPFKGELKEKRFVIKGETVKWSTVGGYLDVIDKAGVSINIATYAGNENIWECVMGQSHARPTAEQFTRMKELLDEAMRDGAFGLSTLLAQAPGLLATTDDLVELGKVVGQRHGIYSSHIRHEGVDVFDAIREAIAIGERAGIPVDIIHMKIADQKYWGRMNEIIQLIEDARRRGVNVQANIYPYTRGNNDLVSIVPPWAHEGGVAKLVERLKDVKLREKMKKDIKEGLPGWYNHYTAVGGDWARMLVAGKCPYEGLTVDRIIEAKNKGKTPAIDPIDIFFDLLIEQNGSISTVFAHHTEKDMNLAMAQPWTSIGSDGSALAVEGPLRHGNPHPRSFGTFPRVLGYYVREQKLLTLEDAVRKMTSLNAAKLGIQDRGLLKAGLFADVTFFDAGKVIDKATYIDPFQYNEGIEYVIVNGQLVLEKGKHTGATPGRALRHKP